MGATVVGILVLVLLVYKVGFATDRSSALRGQSAPSSPSTAVSAAVIVRSTAPVVTAPVVTPPVVVTPSVVVTPTVVTPSVVPPPAAVLCSVPPTVTGTSETSAGAAVTLDLTLANSCVQNAALVRAVHAHVVNEGVPAADGLFTLPQPLWIPAGSSGQLQLTFPSGTYWQSAAALANGNLQSSLTAVDLASSIPTADNTAVSSVTAHAQRTGLTRAVAEARAHAALVAASDNDAAAVSDLSGYWVPQLDSKRNGLLPDGKIYDYVHVWTNYLALKQTYPDAVLFMDDQWTDNPQDLGLWVIAEPMTYESSADAQGWCSAQGLDHDHCLPRQLIPAGSQ